MFSGVGSSTFDRDYAALRSWPLIFCHTDAGTTPVLRTLELYAPKSANIFSFDRAQPFSFRCLEKKMGAHSAGKARFN